MIAGATAWTWHIGVWQALIQPIFAGLQHELRKEPCRTQYSVEFASQPVMCWICGTQYQRVCKGSGRSLTPPCYIRSLPCIFFQRGRLDGLIQYSFDFCAILHHIFLGLRAVLPERLGISEGDQVRRKLVLLKLPSYLGPCARLVVDSVRHGARD